MPICWMLLVVGKIFDSSPSLLPPFLQVSSFNILGYLRFCMDHIKNYCKLLLVLSFLIYLFVIFAVDVYNIDATFQTVHTYTLSSIPDKLDDVSVKLIQNETKVSIEDSSTSEVSSKYLKAHYHDVEFPYMAAIIHKNNLLLGAGAVVGETWILVTGFQMGAFEPDELRVRVGSNSALSGGVLSAVEHLYPHPMFSQFNNDVALVKTTEILFKNSTTQAISIASSSPPLGTEANFIFWNKESQVHSSEADIVPVVDCRIFFPDFELTESNICIVMDHILPYSVTLFGSPVVVNGSLVGLYMGMEANTFKPYLCSSLAPLNEWIQHMMSNATETENLFPIT